MHGGSPTGRRTMEEQSSQQQTHDALEALAAAAEAAPAAESAAERRKRQKREHEQRRVRIGRKQSSGAANRKAARQRLEAAAPDSAAADSAVADSAAADSEGAADPEAADSAAAGSTAVGSTVMGSTAVGSTAVLASWSSVVLSSIGVGADEATPLTPTIPAWPPQGIVQNDDGTCTIPRLLCSAETLATGWAEDAVGSDVVSVLLALVRSQSTPTKHSTSLPGSSLAAAPVVQHPGLCLQMSGALMIGILMLSGVQTQVPQV